MTLETAVAPSAMRQAGARASRIATVLISNAIPLFGVLRYGWSATNVLVLYWLESLLVAIFTCLRIAAHCRLTRLRGHWREGQLTPSPGAIGKRPVLLRDYAVIAFVFTLAHGLFVIVLAFIFTSRHPDSPVWRFEPAPFQHGALLLLAVLVAEFVVDMIGLRARPFAWMRAYTQQRMGRVLILHLAIIFGMFAAAATESPYAILYVLIGLKTLWDLAMSRVGDVAAPAPATPPRWLMKLGDRLGKDKGGSDALARQWTVDVEATHRRSIEDEQPMPR
jgi:hypothetical protein